MKRRSFLHSLACAAALAMVPFIAKEAPILKQPGRHGIVLAGGPGDGKEIAALESPRILIPHMEPWAVLPGRNCVETRLLRVLEYRSTGQFAGDREIYQFQA